MARGGQGLLIWGAVVGALLAMLVSDEPFETLVWGAAIGCGLGAWLRREIRVEIRAAVADVRFEGPDLRTLPPEPPVERAEPERAARARPWEAEAPASAGPVSAPEAVPLFDEPAPEAEPSGRRWLPDFDPVGAARAWLFGGNTIVRVGLVILFVGLSFLASYAAQAGFFPLELRLAAVAATGVGLLLFGFLKRTERPDFGLALQGTGVAAIYLTLFASARLFDVLPPLPALALMALVCALGCALALLQSSQALAVAAFAGGFAAPVLLGGDGSATGLFAYYAVLNLAVLWLTWRRGWRALPVIAFVATFGVMGSWTAMAYAPAEFAVAQAFLLLFLLVHLGNAILLARPRTGLLDQGVQSTILFGPALAGFGIEAVLVRHLPLGTAFAALGFAALYLGSAALMRRRDPEQARLLTDGLLAIGIGFVTLAVPLAFGARWTSAVWALEGAAAFWVGHRQGRWLPRAFGLALALVATLLMLGRMSDAVSAVPLVGPQTLGTALCAAALLAMAWWARAPQAGPAGPVGMAWQAIEARLATPLFLAGFALWAIVLGLEAWRIVPAAEAGQAGAPALPGAWQAPAFTAALLLSAAGAQWLSARFDWAVARWPSLMSLPVLLLFAFARMADGRHVPQWPDALLWPLLLGLHLGMLWKNDREAPARWHGWLHSATVWLGLLLAADLLWFAIDRAGLWASDWSAVALLCASVAVLVLLALWAGRAAREPVPAEMRWPLAPHARAYWWRAAGPVAGLVWLGGIAAGFSAPGETAPLPYVPLLNPVDLCLALAVGGLLLWRRCVQGADPMPGGAKAVAGPLGLLGIGAFAFLALNSAWLRLAHQMLGVDWSAGALAGSGTVQAGLSILWALLAVGLMLFARRGMDRAPWFVGAGLLGLVVLKLLLVDMSSAEGWQRIVAFLGVGVLMLAVGYLVPLPPRTEDAAPEEAMA